MEASTPLGGARATKLVELSSSESDSSLLLEYLSSTAEGQESVTTGKISSVSVPFKYLKVTPKKEETRSMAEARNMVTGIEHDEAISIMRRTVSTPEISCKWNQGDR